MWKLVLTVVVCLPGCSALLGISDPTPADRTDGGGGGDGPPIDSSPPCVTAAVWKPEQTFAIGATGLAFVVANLDGTPGADVAIAVGDGVQIMSGDKTGSFSQGLKITTPAKGLAIGDYDNDGDNDLVVWDEGTTISAFRHNGATYGAEQPLPGPFTSIQGALTGELDAQLVDDILVKDGADVRAFTSKLLNPIAFNREPNPIGNIDAADKLIAVGQLNGQGNDDAAFVSPTGDVKIAFDAPNFTAAAVVATGAQQRCVGFGKLDEDAEIDMIVGTTSGGVIYRGGGGTFAPVSGTLAAVTGPSMQVIDLNGDGRDDLLLADRIVYQCAPAMAGGPGVFTQFEAIDGGGIVQAVDVTGDGKPDLVRVMGTELRVRVHQ